MSRIFEITAQIQTYMPKADVELIQRAYVFAAHAHARQRRRSGELYITHPLGVAKNLVDLKLDVSSVVTGLLHDTVEDTHVTLQDIESRFGVEIASLVDGVTKVGKIHFRSSEHKKAENFRKMIMATAKDLRVLLVKLADRLHNMETLAFMSKEKRKRIAVETMEVYAPLAHRLGIHWVAQKMEDLSFAYIDPEAHDLLQQKLEGKLDFFEKSKLHIEGILHEALSRQGVTARVQGRMKNVYSLHQKMQNKSIDFDKIYDFIAFRVIVDEVATCYHVLGIIHGLYSPVPGRFKDYIALPKPNGYQSLHTVVIGPDHFRIEVQVRSEVMHNYSENGVATHWIYKTAQGLKEEKEREGFQWLQQLAETLHTADDPGEFLENVRLDLFVNEVYIFSRDAELFALPRGSTALDFAYAIHTDLGNHCIGLRVNDEGVELNQKLYNGDQVEVLTNPEQTPSRSWLQFVKTSRAKQSIGYWLRDQEKDAAIILGSHILNNALGQASIGHEMLQLAGCSDDEQLKEKLGRGEIDVSTLLASETKLMSRLLKKKSFTKKNMQAASCCKPIPGDSVIGIFERGEGFMIHDVRCPKVQSEKAKWVEVNWKVESGLLYKTGIEVFCQNEQGSLSLVTSCLAAEGTSIEDLTIKQHPGALSSLYIVVGVRDRFHLSQVLKVLKALKHVSYVRRYDAKQVESEKVASRFNSALHRMTLFGQAVGEVLKEKTRFRKIK